MKIEIDKYAGFCFGVTRAINVAEKNATTGIACLGEIVHNAKEEQRLNSIGMKTISKNDFASFTDKKMMIRAHGEPPSTYEEAKESRIEIIDATCPVVLRLQQRIKAKYLESNENTIVIFGKKGHAEVNGLVGQTEGNAIVISSMEEAENIDLNSNIFLFSQTTSDYQNYDKIIDYLRSKSEKLHGNNEHFRAFQTICPSVKNRIPRLREFCSTHDIVIFVSDYNSSNGKMLYKICKETNANSYFVTEKDDLKEQWFKSKLSVGISGATSTPLWLMQEIAKNIESFKQS